MWGQTRNATIKPAWLDKSAVLTLPTFLLLNLLLIKVSTVGEHFFFYITALNPKADSIIVFTYSGFISGLFKPKWLLQEFVSQTEFWAWGWKGLHPKQRLALSHHLSVRGPVREALTMNSALENRQDVIIWNISGSRLRFSLLFCFCAFFLQHYRDYRIFLISPRSSCITALGLFLRAL